MNQLPTRNPIYRAFMRIDLVVGSTLFELGDLVRRRAMGYAVFLDRFRIRGLRRLLVDALDDGATFAMFAGIGLLMFALPPFSRHRRHLEHRAANTR